MTIVREQSNRQERVEAIVKREHKQSSESRSNRQERAEAIVREPKQSSRESRSNRQDRVEAVVREYKQSLESARNCEFFGVGLSSEQPLRDTEYTTDDSEPKEKRSETQNANWKNVPSHRQCQNANCKE